MIKTSWENKGKKRVEKGGNKEAINDTRDNKIKDMKMLKCELANKNNLARRKENTNKQSLSHEQQ